MIDFSSTQFSSLPAIVQKYFRRVLEDRCPKISIASFKQQGELRTLPTSQRWFNFEAQQTIKANENSFQWLAKISLFPLLNITVEDSYKHGIGSGSVSFLRMTMASDKDRFEMNSGSLHRLLAEAVWCPTLLYPDERHISWRAKDDEFAIATFRDNEISVDLEFQFNSDGEIVGVYSPGRWGKFGKKFRQVGWKGKFSNYTRTQDISYPTSGEVCWEENGKWEPVWRGSIQEMSFRQE